MDFVEINHIETPVFDVDMLYVGTKIYCEFTREHFKEIQKENAIIEDISENIILCKHPKNEYF